MVWKNGSFYYKSIQDCQSYDLQNLKLKIHNFSLELKPSKTPPAASCWIISTLVRRYVFFNPRFCKSWDWPNTIRYIRCNFIRQMSEFKLTNFRPLYTALCVCLAALPVNVVGISDLSLHKNTIYICHKLWFGQLAKLHATPVCMCAQQMSLTKRIKCRQILQLIRFYLRYCIRIAAKRGKWYGENKNVHVGPKASYDQNWETHRTLYCIFIRIEPFLLLETVAII